MKTKKKFAIERLKNIINSCLYIKGIKADKPITKYMFKEHGDTPKYKFPQHSCQILIYKEDGQHAGYFNRSNGHFYMYATHVRISKGGNRFAPKGTAIVVPYMLPIKPSNMRGWKIIKTTKEAAE